MKASLNHIFRTIWSDALNTWVAVSELTMAKGKRSKSCVLSAAELAENDSESGNVAKPNRRLRIKSLVFALACCFSVHANANPTGAQVVNGAATINQTGSVLTVVNTPNAIINWQGFSIGKGETTNFIQQSASSSILNRVVGPDPSTLLGALTSNGKVFLINPAGILVGQGARIDVAGLVTSTLNLSNVNFLAGKLNFDATLNAGAIQNNGTITTPQGGTVYLVAPQIENQGIINTPKGETILAAGNTVQLVDTGTPGVSVEVTGSNNTATNLGQILADTGRIGMVGAVVKNSGTLNANSMVSVGGKVFLKATNSVEAGGTISAQGVGGGNISVLADNTSGSVNVTGTLDASAPNSSNGGFIETSAAHVKVADTAHITTAAPKGKSGTWLIDPVDFTIAANGGDMTGAALTLALNPSTGSNVTILSSTGLIGTAGDINVNDSVTWSANQLTLSAYNNINISASLFGSGTASLALQYGQGAMAAGNTSNIFTHGGAVTLPAGTSNFTTLQGSDGVVKNYTVITNITNLQGMSVDTGLNYALGADINATGFSFTSVGWGISPYYGTFDGLGHTISNLSINQPGDNSIGLFGGLAAGATVRNIGLIGGSVTGLTKVGALVGSNYGKISNSYSTVTVTGSGNVGGLVGANYGTVNNSYATGSVSGGSNIGGLIGLNSGGSVNNTYATGNVSGADNLGGLVGLNSGGTGGDGGADIAGGSAGVVGSNALISNSYAIGSVTGTGNNAGGLVGLNSGGTGGRGGDALNGGTGGAGGAGGLASISNSYATGVVTSSGNNVGGLVGSNSAGSSGSAGFDMGMGSPGVGVVGIGGVGGNTGSITNSHASGNVSSSYGNNVGGLIGANYGGTLDQNYATGNTSGYWYVGGLVGYSLDVTISNSYATGNVSATVDRVGGLVGESSGSGSAITNSYATGYVTGAGYDTGGLVGRNYGIIDTSQAKGNVNGKFNVGGLAGINKFGSTIIHSNASGNVSGNGARVGGLVGDNYGSIGSSFATGEVLGTGVATGGLAGKNYGGSIDNSYATGSVGGNTKVGGLVGWNYGGSVRNSYATGNVSGAGKYVGGLVGMNDFGNGPSGTISASYASGDVSGASDVGGLVGINYATVETSYATGNVNGASEIGGLVGDNNYGTINNSYALGSVNGFIDRVGGLVGFNYGGTINNSYSTGSVTGSGHVGGLVGYNLVGSYYGGGVYNSFWDVQTSGQQDLYDGRGTGLTTADMMNQTTLSNYGFDFTNTWWMIDGNTRPFLQSEWNTTISNAHQLQLISMNLGASYTLANNIDMSVVTQASGMWNTNSTLNGSSGFVPIGNDPGTSTTSNFIGTFDGLNHTISNLVIYRPYKNKIGLFGEIGTAGTVINLVITGADVTGNQNIGGVAGVNTGNVSGVHVINSTVGDPSSPSISNLGGLVGNNSGTISNSYVDNGIVSANAGDWNVGGLAGANSGSITGSHVSNTSVTASYFTGGLAGSNSGNISNSYVSDSTVTAGQTVGGLVGNNTILGSIINSYVSGGSVVVLPPSTGQTLANAGGLVGSNGGTILKSYASGGTVGSSGLNLDNLGGLAGANTGSISYSYATDSVSGRGNVGGLVGDNGTGGTIDYTYSVGAVTGSSNLGGLVGHTNAASNSVNHSYYDSTRNPALPGIGNDVNSLNNNVAPLTTTQMMDHTQFVGWDFSSAGSWFMIDGNTRPFLRSEWSTTISNSHQLQLMAMNLGANYTVANNINLSDITQVSSMWSSAGYVPIGNLSTPFTGTLNGANYILSNLYVHRPSENYVGLIGFASGSTNAPSLISNVILDHANVTGNVFVGALVGENSVSQITNSGVKNSIVRGNKSVGGLVGYNSGSVSNSYVSGGSVSGSSKVGGLAGNNVGNISNSYASGGSVSASWGNSGGLVGFNDGSTSSGLLLSGGSITHSYVENGTVSGGRYTGGLAGHNFGLVSDSHVRNSTVTSRLWGAGGLVGVNGTYTLDSYFHKGGLISNSYVSGGTVSASSSVGGLVGYNLGNISNSYVSGGQVSGNVGVGGLVGDNGHNGSINFTYTAGGIVTGRGYSGGLVGYNDLYAYISDSYASNVLTNGTSGISGALVGANFGSINNSIWDTDIAGLTGVGSGTDSGNQSSVTGLTTAQMMSLSTNPNTITIADFFDFSSPTSQWFMIDGNTRPFLRSEWSTTITNTHQLQLMQMNLSANYTLANDINLSEITLSGGMWNKDTLSNYGSTGFVPIGYNNTFSGTFDGQNHTLSNLTINRPNENEVGLFGYVNGSQNTPSVISNLVLNGANVTGLRYVGGLVGHNAQYAQITNSAVNNSTVTGYQYVGGLVGYNDGGISHTQVINSSVNGTYQVGGLVGFNNGYTSSSGAHYGGNITQSFVNNGIVSGNSSVGGLVGLNQGIVSTSLVSNGSVSGTYNNVGGLVGINGSSCSDCGGSTGRISNSYVSNGSVTGRNYVGGLVGYNSSAISTSTVSGGSVTGWFAVGGLLGYNSNGSGSHNYNYGNIDSSQVNNVSVSSSSSDVGGLLGFNSRNCTISNSYVNGGSVNGTSSEIGGLVGDNRGYIQTSHVDNPTVSGNSHVGGLVGYNYSSSSSMRYSASISNSYVSGGTVNGIWDVGGLAGYNRDILDNVHVVGTSVYGSTSVGGLVGYNTNSISNSYVSGGSVMGGNHLGGLVGYNTSTGSIDQSHVVNLTDTNGTWDVGGLVGYNRGSISNSDVTNSTVHSRSSDVGGLVGYNRGSISYSYVNGGSVSANSWSVGGLVGYNDGSISNSYVTNGTIVSGTRYVGGLAGGGYGSVDSSWVNGVRVSGSASVGGLMGYNNGSISNSYASGGSVAASSWNVGGLVGHNAGSISNSYVSTGSVTGLGNFGGLVGKYDKGSISNSHYNISSVLINGSNQITFGGLFDDDTYQRGYGQYTDWLNKWLNSGLSLNISDYTTLAGSNNSFSISNVQGMKDLLGFADNSSYTFSLSRNITLTPGLYIPYLAANFDGAGHTISGLNLNQPNQDKMGLFGQVAAGSSISNLGLLDATVVGNNEVGALAGHNQGFINNSFSSNSPFSGAHVTGNTKVGGLVGSNVGTYSVDTGLWGGGNISGSYVSNGTINGSVSVGGLVGFNTGSIVGYNYGTSSNTDNNYVVNTTVTGGLNSSEVGGLVGSNAGYIDSAYADTVTVSGHTKVGGLVGYNGTASAPSTNGGTKYVTGSISNSYVSNGNVTGNSYVGGLAGYNYGTIQRTYTVGGGVVASANTGPGNVGGLVGYNDGRVTNSYSSTGVVCGGECNYGGIVGQNSLNGFIDNVFWDTQTFGGAGIGGGAGNINVYTYTGLTTAGMMYSGSNIYFLLNSGGWWMSDYNTRPFLRSEWSTNVNNAHQLQLMAMDLTASYKLVNNLDLAPALDNSSITGMWSNAGFSPVGGYRSYAFMGGFDGQDHTISNLTIDRPSQSYVGLFGQAGYFSNRSTTIKNLSLANARVTGSSYVGGLVGSNYGSISNSHVTGGRITGNNYVGGLAGYNDNQIDSSDVSGGSIVTGSRSVGGLVGSNYGSISNSYVNSGNVNGNNDVGGLVGYNAGYINVNQVIGGQVNGNNYVGGLVGYNRTCDCGNLSGHISNSYVNTGTIVTGSHEVGGLTGLNDGMIDSSGVDTVTVHGNLAVGGLVGKNWYSITNSYVNGGTVIGITSGSYGPQNIGGLVGHNMGTVDHSHVSGNSHITGKYYVGGLVGANGTTSDSSITGGTISNSYVDGGVVTGTGSAVGGLAGYNSRSISYSQVSNGTVNGSWDVGGLVGTSTNNYSNATISNSSSSNMMVTATQYRAGGLVGNNHGSIDSSQVSSGTVSGLGSVGGLVGSNGYGNGSISNSSSSHMTVSATGQEAGGLVGQNGGLIDSSHVDHVIVSGSSSVGGLVGYNYGGVSNSYVESGSVSGNVNGSWGLGGLLGGYNSGTVTNSHFNVNGVTVDGSNQVTFGGLYNTEYVDWTTHSLTLNIANYTGTSNSFQLINGKYVISTLQGMKDLLGFADTAGISFTLGNDISLVHGYYVPILAASFDGAGHTISSLYLSQPGNYDLGLFGHIVSGSTVSNVSLLNAHIEGSSSVGALAGRNEGSISGSHSTNGTIISTNTSSASAGGLVGYNFEGGISSSYVSGGSVSATGGYHVGGLVGGNYGNLASSYTSGVSLNAATSNDVGGLAGYNYGNISNSFAIGNSVSGAGRVGGLVGWNTVIISNSYVSGGSVSAAGGADVGGLVGRNTSILNNSITTSYASGVHLYAATSNDVGGLVGYNDGDIRNNFATANIVTGASSVGGLVGYNGGSDASSIKYSYVSGGSVSGTANVGGLVGYKNGGISGAIVGNIWDTGLIAGNLTQGIGNDGGAGSNNGMTPLSSSAMMVMSNFTNAGWSIANTGGAGATWRIYEGFTMPLLTSLLTPLTVTANNVVKSYDGLTVTSLSSPAYSVTGAGTSGHISNLSNAYNGAVNAGSYTPALYSDQLGYDISYGTGSSSGTLTINPAQLIASTINLTGMRAYDGTVNVDASIFTLNGLIGNQTLNLAGVGTVPNKNVGTYTVSLGSLALHDGSNGGLASNYTLSGGSHTATIIARALTGSIATGSSTYGATLAPGVVNFTNAILTDNLGTATVVINSNSGQLSSSGNLKAGSYTGIETITGLSGPDAGNYTFTNVVGNYTVNKLALTGSITPGSSQYGATLSPGTANLSGAIQNDQLGTATVTVNTTGHTSLSGHLNAGSYTGIETVSGLSGADGANYSFAGVLGSYSVGQLGVTLIAPAVTKIYDGGLNYTAGGNDLAALSAQLLAGDKVSSARFVFLDPAIGVGNKTVNMMAATINDGNNGNNYILNYLQGGPISTNTNSTIISSAITVPPPPQIILPPVTQPPGLPPLVYGTGNPNGSGGSTGGSNTTANTPVLPGEFKGLSGGNIGGAPGTFGGTHGIAPPVDFGNGNTGNDGGSGNDPNKDRQNVKPEKC